jgi:hypothetical protein
MRVDIAVTSNNVRYDVSYGCRYAVSKHDAVKMSNALRMDRYGSDMVDPTTVTASFLAMTIDSHATITPDRFVS